MTKLWIDRAAAFFRMLERRIGSDVGHASCQFDPPLSRIVLDQFLGDEELELPGELYDFYTQQAVRVEMSFEMEWQIDDCTECWGGVFFQHPIVPVADGLLRVAIGEWPKTCKALPTANSS